MLIDTERAKQTLTSAGIPEEHASAYLDVVRMIDEEARAKLVTKDDLKLTEERLRRQMIRTVWGGVAALAALMTLFNFL